MRMALASTIFNRVLGHQHRGHLGQAHLGPDHVFAAAAADPMLAANPDAAVGCRRIDQQDIHRAWRPSRRRQRLHACPSIRKFRRAQRRNPPRAQIVANILRQFIVLRGLVTEPVASIFSSYHSSTRHDAHHNWVRSSQHLPAGLALPMRATARVRFYADEAAPTGVSFGSASSDSCCKSS